MTPMETVVDRLEGAKRMGKGFTAQCPSHQDRVNSLKVDEAPDGKALLFCHAGCSTEQVVADLGLTLADLMPEREPQNLRLEDAVSVYDYHDESGKLEFKVGRFTPKTFRPFHKDGNRWALGQGRARRLPFRLPKILEARASNKYIGVVEGEKDVLTLENHGLVATCNPGGAGKWSAEWAAYFADASVVLIPDNDDPGRAHMHTVAESLLGVARKLRVLHLPGLPAKGDVTDWFTKGHGADELKQLILSAPEFTPATFDMDIVTVSEVQARRVQWLWPDYIPLGKLITLEGDPGLGKSSIVLDLAARLSVGSEMPDGERLPESSNVLLFSAEDAIADTIRPRLEAAGADLTRIHVVTAIHTEDGRRQLEIPQDIERMENVINAHGVKLVAIDPFVSFIDPDLDAHKDQSIRRALMPLADLADRTGAAILLMRHLSKGQGKAIYRGGGSIGIIGQVRAGLVVAKDPLDESRRVLAVAKANLAREATSLLYRIVPADLLGVGKVKWLGACELSADEVLNPPRKKTRAEKFMEGEA